MRNGHTHPNVLFNLIIRHPVGHIQVYSLIVTQVFDPGTTVFLMTLLSHQCSNYGSPTFTSSEPLGH